MLAACFTLKYSLDVPQLASEKIDNNLTKSFTDIYMTCNLKHSSITSYPAFPAFKLPTLTVFAEENGRHANVAHGATRDECTYFVNQFQQWKK